MTKRQRVCVSQESIICQLPESTEPHLYVPIIRLRYTMKEESLVLTFKISIWTRLQTNCQVDHIVVRGRAIEARILSGACTRLTRLMTWPANASLIWKTPRWASAYASAVIKKIKFVSLARR